MQEDGWLPVGVSAPGGEEAEEYSFGISSGWVGKQASEWS